jgi:hypothetical protein
MEKARIIRVDLAKRAFQLHGATADGQPVLRKKVPRAQLLSFLAGHPRAVVAMRRVQRRTAGAEPFRSWGTRSGSFHRFT